MSALRSSPASNIKIIVDAATNRGLPRKVGFKMRFFAVLTSFFLLSACGESEEKELAQQRTEQRDAIVNKILERGPISEVVALVSGELVTVSTPYAGRTPGLIRVKTCRIWRDISLGQSSLECEDDDDVLRSLEKLEEFSKRPSK